MICRFLHLKIAISRSNHFTGCGMFFVHTTLNLNFTNSRRISKHFFKSVVKKRHLVCHCAIRVRVGFGWRNAPCLTCTACPPFCVRGPHLVLAWGVLDVAWPSLAASPSTNSPGHFLPFFLGAIFPKVRPLEGLN